MTPTAPVSPMVNGLRWLSGLPGWPSTFSSATCSVVGTPAWAKSGDPLFRSRRPVPAVPAAATPFPLAGTAWLYPSVGDGIRSFSTRPRGGSSHEPSLLRPGGRRHPDDRLVQGLPAHRAVELGRTEGEQAAVTGDFPVAMACGRGGHADHRLVERLAAPRAAELG